MSGYLYRASVGLLFFFVCSFTGCSELPAHVNSQSNLILYDESGSVVASGELAPPVVHSVAPDSPPCTDPTFDGQWRVLEYNVNSFPGNYVISPDWQPYVGELGLGGPRIELSTGQPDNQLSLAGQQNSSRFGREVTGTWSITTPAGSKSMGNFILWIKLDSTPTP